MKISILYRHQYPCSYRADLACHGLLIINALRRTSIPATDIAVIVARSLSLPAGMGFFLALRACPSNTLTTGAEYLRLWSPMQRHERMKKNRHPHASILVPNVYRDLPKSTLKRFAAASDVAVISAVAQYADGYLPATTPWLTLLKWFDACAIGSGYSPAMVGYCNFVGDFAMPSISDLEL